MRVIAGTARSIPLKAPAGMDTRPTTDKIKETLFNMLQFEIGGALFLDIFAGSGAIGIEALSRGAERAVFIDKARAAVDIIEYNLKKCHFEGRARVVRGEAVQAVNYLQKRRGQRLVVFMDPPYNKGLEIPVLKVLMERGALDEDTLLIVEEALEFDAVQLEAAGYEVIRVKEYKSQKHIFLRPGGTGGTVLRE